MGRKVHPIGFRLGYIKDWQSKWFADRTYTDQLHEDIMLRAAITRELANAGVARVEVERSANKIEVTVFTAKPGIVMLATAASPAATAPKVPPMAAPVAAPSGALFGLLIAYSRPWVESDITRLTSSAETPARMSSSTACSALTRDVKMPVTR